jgi:hypothetical protein
MPPLPPNYHPTTHRHPTTTQLPPNRHPTATQRQPPPNRQVFNKIDIARHDFALEWMGDFDAYAAALEADSSYASTLSRWVRV